jgi:Rha family phage regulatory protein
MKELIARDEFGIFVNKKDAILVDSLYVAKFFDKEHKNVIRDIERLLEENSGLSSQFNTLNFERISYKDTMNRNQRAYAMTRDGFVILAMGYTGKKAMEFKEAYIKRFNEMELFMKTLLSARKEFPELAENIKLIHEHPKPYHFSNECDMINRVAIGMTAKQFRIQNEIKDGESIRPYLNEQQIKIIDALQKIDIGFLLSIPDYEQRKRQLEWYKLKKFGS